MSDNFYLVGGYVPAGGAFMAYEVAHIAATHFNKNVKIVSLNKEEADCSFYNYPELYPRIEINQMLEEAKATDYLCCNPSFSFYGFGLSFPGKKIMYAQGFNTFQTIDIFFDHYVSVSPFVRNYLECVYGIKSNYIPAFIDINLFEPVLSPLEQTNRLRYHCKDNSFLGQNLLESIISKINHKFPSLEIEPLIYPNEIYISKKDIFSRFSNSKAFISLSPAEGFGLLPLEAMASGCLVIAFDGFGGRAYMKDGINCFSKKYGEISSLVDSLSVLESSPTTIEKMRMEAQKTAPQFSYDRFQQNWIYELEKFFHQ